MQQLLVALEATLSPEAAVRQTAEAALEQGARQPGFASALLAIMLSSELPLGARQLAAVVLRKTIKEHCEEEMTGWSCGAQAHATLPRRRRCRDF